MGNASAHCLDARHSPILHRSDSPNPPLIKEDIDTVDHAVVNIQYANGGVATLALCMYLRPENTMPEGLEIGAIGLNGTQMCAYRDSRLGWGGGSTAHPWTWIDYDQQADSQGLGHIGCQNERVEFLECVRERRRPFADGAVGRSSLLIALAAEESIQTGRPVDIARQAAGVMRARPPGFSRCESQLRPPQGPR